MSREHHDGLLFAWKLRQGLANETPLQTLRKYCCWYWKNYAQQHFDHEENILLKYIPSDNAMARQLTEEHNNIRELILSIDHKADATTIGMLADFISRHIRFEERTLFNYLEQNLTARQLDDIFFQLAIQQIASMEWNDEFWIRKEKGQRTDRLHRS